MVGVVSAEEAQRAQWVSGKVERVKIPSKGYKKKMFRFIFQRMI
jgi:hypothetical protein